MKAYGKQMVVALAIGVVGLPALAAGAGKATFKEFTIKKATHASDDAQKETIEIASWSLGVSNPTANTYRGTTTINEGVLRLNATSVPSSVARLCQSHATIPSMTIESDGQRQEFRDVVFQQCPAGGVGTFTLTFNGQTTAAPRPATESMRELPNVTIKGFTPMKSQNNLKQMTISANSATIYVGSANGGVWKTTNGGATWTRGQQFPLVVIEGQGGTTLSFTRVSLSDVVSTMMPTPPGSAPVEVQKITFTFESTTATPQLIDAILAGRS